jgi:hypothetical protein
LHSQDSKLQWFSDRNFPDLTYDLLECQVYSGTHFLKAEKQDYKGIYVPVNIGVKKNIFQLNFLENNISFSIGAASFTQFEIIKYDENNLRGGLLNNDYKAAGFLTYANQKYKLRLQLFHISSHLGDDYMIRNEHFVRNDKKVNYEQADLIYLKELSYAEIYGGVGFVITPNAFRKRFMVQVGIQSKTQTQKRISIVSGCDIKIYNENNFIPDIHASGGIGLMQNNQLQATFLLDGYFGHMPYSTLKFGKVMWLGLSTVITI